MEHSLYYFRLSRCKKSILLNRIVLGSVSGLVLVAFCAPCWRLNGRITGPCIRDLFYNSKPPEQYGEKPMFPNDHESNRGSYEKVARRELGAC